MVAKTYIAARIIKFFSQFLSFFFVNCGHFCSFFSSKVSGQPAMNVRKSYQVRDFYLETFNQKNSKIAIWFDYEFPIYYWDTHRYHE